MLVLLVVLVLRCFPSLSLLFLYLSHLALSPLMLLLVEFVWMLVVFVVLVVMLGIARQVVILPYCSFYYYDGLHLEIKLAY